MSHCAKLVHKRIQRRRLVVKLWTFCRGGQDSEERAVKHVNEFVFYVISDVSWQNWADLQTRMIGKKGERAVGRTMALGRVTYIKRTRAYRYLSSHLYVHSSSTVINIVHRRRYSLYSIFSIFHYTTSTQ